MGRLFWKFFLFIWLAQLASIVGTGFLFWLEREQRWLEHRRPELPGSQFGPPAPLAQPSGEPPGFRQPPPPGDGEMRGPAPRLGPDGPEVPHFALPLVPAFVGLLASLLCAALLAWYIARPVGRLRQAFAAAAEGELDQHLAEAMGGRRDELADLGRQFDSMTGRLDALMGSQKRLLHDVSHELRSPLARLQAAIGLLRQQPERLDDSLARIEREGERMNRLVGELLTLARLESGVSGAVEVVDLPELLEGLVDDARFEAATRNLTVDLPEMPKIAVRANPQMLHRAIENVVRNALRHSHPGGRVTVELQLLEAATCRLRVLDQGAGVPPDMLERIFTPFVRNDERREGYGLGLAIARRALAAIGGSIEAENRPEGGFAVSMTLPTCTAAD